MIEVYHANKPRFLRSEETAEKFPEGFTLVAKVSTHDREEAFELTNSINKSWCMNRRVEAVVKNTRSTSVGDVFVMEDGTKFEVASVGYRELT